MWLNASSWRRSSARPQRSISSTKANTVIPRCAARVSRSPSKASGSQERTAYDAPLLLCRDLMFSYLESVTCPISNIVLHDLHACKCPEARQLSYVCLLLDGRS